MAFMCLQIRRGNGKIAIEMPPWLFIQHIYMLETWQPRTGNAFSEAYAILYRTVKSKLKSEMASSLSGFSRNSCDDVNDKYKEERKAAGTQTEQYTVIAA